MPYVVKDRIEVSVFFNDTEYPLGLGQNSLNFLHMAASSKFRLPTVHLSVVDSLHLLDVMNLQDGLKIKVQLKAKGGPTRTFEFRKFNHKRVFQGDAYCYALDGYYDAPKFWIGTGTAAIEGSSNDVLKRIADQCGLGYDGVATNDTMLWLQRNRPWSMYARSIEANGYVNSTSFMKWAVQFDGTLVYVNLNQMPPPGIKVIAYQSSDDAFTAVDYGASTKSGFTNAINGYSSARQEQSAIGQAEYNKDLKLESDSRSPMINKAVKDEAERGSVSYGPIDFGNVHPAYEKAYYQNQRYASLFNVDVEFLFNQPTLFEVFTPFTFAASNDLSRQDAAYSGDYITSAQAIYISGADYFEKVVGTRNGTNLNYLSG